MAPARLTRMEIFIAGVALTLPAIASFILPGALDPVAAVLWFIALVPVLLLSRVRGPKGSAGAAGVVLALMGVTEAISALVGRGSSEPRLLVGVAVIFAGVSAGMAWLSGSFREERDRVAKLAYTDPLTDLPNRRHAQAFLDTEFGAAERGREVAAVLFDLDRFKEFNDTHGHAAGDRALQTFAHLLERYTRKMNLTARYGGEEFLAVLSETDEEGAIAFAERIREAVEMTPMDDGTLTVSAGVAVYSPKMHLPDDLVAAADRALYLAKRDGRNCVRTDPGEEAAGEESARHPGSGG